MAQEYLPAFLQDCRFRQQRRIAAEQVAAPLKSEDDVNLLIIFAVCVSGQMKLINRGRNVTLSKVLTSKSKYLHRCAGSCLLLGITMCLEQFMPAWSVDPVPQPQHSSCHCSAPSSNAGSFVPGLGGAEGKRGSTALQPGCPEGATLVGAWVICTEGMSSAAQF